MSRSNVISPGQNKPTLLIGHHLLEGKIANLPKPLAVLLRSTPAAGVASVSAGGGHLGEEEDGGDVEMMDSLDDGTGDNQGGEATTREGEEGKEVEWDMVAVVKRKIVFADRPMPIVNLHKPQ